MVRKETRKKEAGVGRDQHSIRSYSLQYTKPEQSTSKDVYTPLVQAGKKTLNFPQFQLSHLDEFYQWLTTVEGKLRNATTAREICVDVSKCLRYHSPLLSWDHLLDTSNTHKYLQVCQEVGVQADGLVTKCDRIITSLTFVRMEKTKPDDHRRRATVDAAIERINTWKRVWRKGKGKARDATLAESVDTVPDITSVTKIIRMERLWEDFEDVCANNILILYVIN